MKNSKIKKKIGENLYNYLIRNFPDETIEKQVNSIFLLSSDAREIKSEDYQKLKDLINSKTEKTEVEEKEKQIKTSKELLDEVGFVLDDKIESKKDYVKYSKYFEKSEKLCKFSSYDATNRYYKLFFILRKNYKELKRKDFKNPARQDEYSTSVMSVGISSDKKNVAQITSRYNHAVSGCDNTYNGNLDNIAKGLTDAINRDYKLNIGANATLEFDNFYFHNGKYIYYYRELDGKKIGNNTVDGVFYDLSRYYFFENFILDLKEKKLENISKGYTDDFITQFNEKIKNGAKIVFSKSDNFDEIEDSENIIYFFID